MTMIPPGLVIGATVPSGVDVLLHPIAILGALVALAVLGIVIVGIVREAHEIAELDAARRARAAERHAYRDPRRAA